MPRSAIFDGALRRRIGPVGSILALVLLSPGLLLAAANTIADVTWTADESGNTVITVSATGAIDPASYRAYSLTAPPRIVASFSGVDAPFLPDEVPVGDANVDLLRIGYHREFMPPELHVVVDLTSETVEILDIGHDRNRVVVVVGPSRAPEPTPTQPPSPSPIIPPSPGPPPPPSPSPTIPPSATPTQRPSPTPTGGQPVYPDRPPPPVLPVERRDSSPPPTSALGPPAVPRVFPTPTPDRHPGVATHVIDLATSVRSDGSTLLRVTADGDFPKGCARFMEIDDDPPRVVVTIHGVSAPDLARTIEIGDVNLEKIRLIHDAEVSEGELHLVLHLNGSEIGVAELEQVGPHIVVRLTAPIVSEVTP
jgi:hypothetical protein